MRKETKKRGLDPAKWFNNVEIVTAEKIGIETTTYARNIFKYYVSYKLTLDAQATAAKLKQQVAPQRTDGCPSPGTLETLPVARPGTGAVSRDIV